jgi:hypothetical protein
MVSVTVIGYMTGSSGHGHASAAVGISEVAYERLPVWRQREDDLPWT